MISSIIKSAQNNDYATRLLKFLQPRNLSLSIGYILLFLIFITLVLVPLFLLLKASFWTTGPFESGGTFTIQNYIETYLNPQTYLLFINTVVLAVGATAVAGGFGISMAWVVARTNSPLRGLLVPFMIFPQLVPGYLIATAFIFLLGPRIGLLNQFIHSIGIGMTFNIYSWWGNILVLGIGGAPIAFIITLPAFRNFNPALEEASRMTGAGTLTTLRRITLPMVFPAASASMLLIFTKILGRFGTPAFLGLPRDPPIVVFAVRLWQAFSRDIPPSFGLGTALATTLLGIGIIGLIAQRTATKNEEKYTTVTGQGFTAQRYDLGKWRWVVSLTAIGILTIFLVLPFILLMIASVSSHWFGRLFFLDDTVYFTLDMWAHVLTSPSFNLAIFNSLIIATVGAFLAMIFATMSAYFVVKVRKTDSYLIGNTSGILDQIGFIPAAVPGIVTATGFLWFAVTIPIVGLYGSIWLIMLAYIARELPEGTRTMNSAITQLDDELEDQARIAGANWWQSLKDIITPLLNRSFVAGYLLIFVDLLKNLSVPIMLYDHNSLVIPVLIFNLKNSGDYAELAAMGVILFVMGFAVLLIAKYFFGVSFVEIE